MLHRQRQAFLREVEHVENDGLGAAVLAVVYHWVVMPTKLLSRWNFLFNSNYFRLTYQIVGKVHAVPALASVNQFCGLHRRDFFHCKYFGAKLRCII